MSFFEKLSDQIIPDTSLHGISDYLMVKKDGRVVANVIFILKENPYVDLFREFTIYLNDKKSEKSI